MPLINVGSSRYLDTCSEACRAAEGVCGDMGCTDYVFPTPSGLQAEVLASGAGDAAMKLWSFSRRRCMATLHGDLPCLEGFLLHFRSCPLEMSSHAHVTSPSC